MSECIYNLNDGRQLSYAFYGPADGEPVLYFHGTPSSRLEPLLLNKFDKDVERLLHKNNIHLIAIDRPGIGKSSYNIRGSITSFANDVKELMDALTIGNCKILCWSGGGPYALSLAYHYKQMITGVYIITGFTRSFSEHRVFRNMNGNIYYFWLAKNASWFMRLIMNHVGKKETQKPLPQWLSKLPDVDHNLMKDSSVINYFTKITLNEACRSNSRGLVNEAAMYFNETGYKLNEITQPVHYWWGTKDNTVTSVHAYAVETQVPKAIMHYKPNEGHLSVFINYFEEVLETIAAKSV